MVIPVGSIVNAGAIIAGSLVGLVLGKLIPERIKITVFQGFGICTLVIGLKMALDSHNLMVMVFSVALGAITGELLHLERHLNNLGDWIKKLLSAKNPTFTEGLVNSSVIFCVGAMAIIGGLEEGLRGDRATFYTKATLDGFAAIFLSSTYGFGVFWSFAVVLVYQSVITVFAGYLEPLLSPAIINSLTATGGVLIMGIGLNFLGVKRVPLSNLLPALAYAIIIASFL